MACTERLWVRFPVMACTWVVGFIPSWGAYKRKLTDVSLSHRCFSLYAPPNTPKINGHILGQRIKIINSCSGDLHDKLASGAGSSLSPKWAGLSVGLLRSVTVSPGYCCASIRRAPHPPHSKWAPAMGSSLGSWIGLLTHWASSPRNHYRRHTGCGHPPFLLSALQ